MATNRLSAQTGIRIEAWRCNVLWDKRSRITANKTLELQLRVQDEMRGAAIRQFKCIIARMMRGELGLRVLVWRSAMRQSHDAARERELQREFCARALSQKSGALRQLRRTLVSIAKGVVAMRVEVWRMATQMTAHQRMLQMQAALETQMRGQSLGTGLRTLRQIMAHQARGEIGLRVEVWRTGMQDDQRARELDRMQQEWEERTLAGRLGSAMRSVRAILTRSMRGSTAMLIEVWRTAVKQAEHANLLQVRSALTAQLNGKTMSAGMRTVRQLIAQNVKGSDRPTYTYRTNVHTRSLRLCFVIR